MRTRNLLAVLLLAGCASTDTDRNGVSLTSYAALRVIDIPGDQEDCQHLVDIEYRLANRDASSVPYRPTRTQADLEDDVLAHTAAFKAFLVEEQGRLNKSGSSSSSSKRPDDYEAAIRELLIPRSAILPAPTRPNFSNLHRAFEDSGVPAKVEAEQRHKRKVAAMSRREGWVQSLLSRGDTSRDGPDRFITVNEQIRQHYVRQRNEPTCYAASLNTVWDYMGWPATYDDFIAKRVPSCGHEKQKARSATFIEIISTAYHVRTGTNDAYLSWQSAAEVDEIRRLSYRQTRTAFGIVESSDAMWLTAPSAESIAGSIFGAGAGAAAPPIPSLQSIQNSFNVQQPNHGNFSLTHPDGTPVNLFSSRDWSLKSDANIKGHMQPLLDTGHLVVSVLRRSGILIGLVGREGGHTYLVTGVDYTPDYYFDDEGAVITAATEIHRVRLLDPSPSVQPEFWVSADEFLKRYRFGFEIYEDRSHLAAR